LGPHTVANRFFARLFEIDDAPTPPPPGLNLLYKYVELLHVIFPPGFIFVLRLPPTPTFFLYKKPYGPYQNWPLEGPDPNADMYIYSIRKSLLEKRG
jgi:hypothetical protein